MKTNVVSEMRLNIILSIVSFDVKTIVGFRNSNNNNDIKINK